MGYYERTHEVLLSGPRGKEQQMYWQVGTSVAHLHHSDGPATSSMFYLDPFSPAIHEQRGMVHAVARAGEQTSTRPCSDETSENPKIT